MSEIPAFNATLKAEFGKLSTDKALQDYIKSGDAEKFILKTFDTVKPDLLDMVMKGALG
jgi:predicted glycosyltransferase